MENSAQLGVILNQRYRLLKQLGCSDVSVTYLVEDTHRFNELCVVKELIPQQQSAEFMQKTEELFEREAKVLYKLQHPQIPRFRELFRHENHLYLVQDYIQGQTYHDLLKLRQSQGQTFNESEAIELLQQILPVLLYIHARGIIHRDISPHNLILRRSDQLPVLIDFGNVKQLANNNTTSSGQPITVAIATELGEMSYAPPEQIQTGMVYPHSDLYALAATILVLLSGKKPQQLLPQGSWQKEVNISAKFKNILVSMLAENPKERFLSAHQVIEALQKIEAELPQLNPVPAQTQATVVITPESILSNQEKEPISLEFSLGENQITSPEPVSEISNSSSKNMSMASTASRSRNFFSGCLSKILIVLILSLGSGIMGWFAGKLWINQVTQNPLQSISLNNSHGQDSDSNQSGISDQEWKRKQELQKRRLELGLNNQYFYNLVDQMFAEKYPSQAGKTLTNKPEDDSWREKWDKIASELLDKLSTLSQEARQGLGQYNQAQRQQWIQEVNKLYLSSRALYNLADNTFFYYFPEQENQGLRDKPLSQVWSAFVFDKLEALKSGEIYTEIVFFPDDLETSYQKNLEPGAGMAYVVKLDAGKFLELKLNAPRNVLLSVYSPTGRNNLLEDSSIHQWSGELPETGYYEIIIVSQAKRNIDYQLNLNLID